MTRITYIHTIQCPPDPTAIGIGTSRCGTRTHMCLTNTTRTGIDGPARSSSAPHAGRVHGAVFTL
jgi:hypothetical protein